MTRTGWCRLVPWRWVPLPLHWNGSGQDNWIPAAWTVGQLDRWTAVHLDQRVYGARMKECH
jgi:hypothetical protein